MGAASLTLNAGQFVELETTLAGGGCFISADKPVGTAIAPFVPTGNTQLNEHYALVVTATGVTNINTGVPATTFTSPTGGATFAWTNSNTAIGLAAAGTGNQPLILYKKRSGLAPFPLVRWLKPTAIVGIGLKPLCVFVRPEFPATSECGHPAGNPGKGSFFVGIIPEFPARPKRNEVPRRNFRWSQNETKCLAGISGGAKTKRSASPEFPAEPKRNEVPFRNFRRSQNETKCLAGISGGAKTKRSAFSEFPAASQRKITPAGISGGARTKRSAPPEFPAEPERNEVPFRNFRRGPDFVYARNFRRGSDFATGRDFRGLPEKIKETHKQFMSLPAYIHRED